MVLIACTAFASATTLRDMKVEVSNKASLQRGAKIYMNLCSGCHTLKYLRYNRLAQDLGITDFSGNIDTELLTNNLILTQANPHEPIDNAMPKEDAREWFGVVPPDLSLVARVRGAKWLFSYLTSFYFDPTQPFGTNNLVYSDVAMPNVLLNLQGRQLPLYKEELIRFDGETTFRTVEGVQLIQTGLMDQHEFDSVIQDLVNFLVYASEPILHKRRQIGMAAVLFLGLVLVCVYRLKKAYWKNISKKLPE